MLILVLSNSLEGKGTNPQPRKFNEYDKMTYN